MCTFVTHFLYTSTSIQEQKRIELADTPSDWSMLTVSDCNMCALINMVDADTTTEIVLSQLSLILNNNLEQAGTLEEALASNNEGLPFDMYLDTRSKKTNNSKMDATSSPRLPNITKFPNATPSPTCPTSSNSVDSKQKIELLYKTPHFVMCQSPNGAMSCFVTIPPPTESSAASLFPPGTKLPLPSISQSLQMDLKAPQKLSNGKRGIKKAPDTQQKIMSSKIAGVLSKMQPLAKQPNHKKPTVSTSTEAANTSSSDYDADIFSDFAHRLSTDGVTPDLERNVSDIDESHKINCVHDNATATTKSENDVSCVQQNFVSPIADIPKALASQQATDQQPFLANTSDFCGGLQECDILGIDIDDESVQQLLQLSPGLSVSKSTNHIEPPPSPFTQLMNSLTSPSNESAHYVSSKVQPNSNASNEWYNPTMLGHQQSSSSIDLPLNVAMNQHPSFQLPINFSSPTDSPHLNMSKESDTIHNVLQQSENHLLKDTSNKQGSYHHPGTLYSLPNGTSSFSQFPESLLPAREYRDLESLMNTVITNNDADMGSVNYTQSATTLTNSTFNSQLAGADLYSLDTNSATSLASSDISSQDQGSSHHFSLPDLTLEDHDTPQANTENAAIWSQFLSDHTQASTQSTSARSSSCLSNVSALQDIPEGSPMDLEEIPFMRQLEVCDYRTGASSMPSSPGQASVSSHSSLSAHDMFDSGSPSVLELCEMLSESSNVQKHDFSHLTLSGM